MTRWLSTVLILLTGMSGLALRAARLEAHRNEIAGGYNFWLNVPTDTSTAKPLVIFLHGRSLSGNDLNKVKKYGTIAALEAGRQIDAYVLAPQSPGGGWKPAKIKEVMDWVVDRHNVDTTRVYVLGMSLGGIGTIDFAAAYPDEIAGAIGLCGGSTARNLSDLNKLPLWIVHGTADTAINVSQSDKVVLAMYEADNSTPRLVYDRVPGMNHSQPARMFYMPEVYDWLFQHSLSEEGRPIHETFEVTTEAFRHAYDGLNMRKGGSR